MFDALIIHIIPNNYFVSSVRILFAGLTYSHGGRGRLHKIFVNADLIGVEDLENNFRLKLNYGQRWQNG